MAGWKLRKDKTPAETPGTETEAGTAALDTASAEDASGTHGAPFLDTVPGLPDFDADTHFAADTHSNGLQFNADAPGHADGIGHANGPLTLVNYNEPDSAVSLESHAHIYDAPGHADSAVIAMPPPEPAASVEPEFETETGFDADAEFEPISGSSSWLSSDFSADTPAVAPFVLDTPVPAAPATAPQVVVHIGRMSAPFLLTKDVTTIGRPDSALSHYPDVEIDMDDAVSRRHCEIVRREDGYYLVDTGSTNGTRLNGETLLPHQEHLLAHGDRVHLGDRTEITFE